MRCFENLGCRVSHPLRNDPDVFADTLDIFFFFPLRDSPLSSSSISEAASLRAHCNPHMFFIFAYFPPPPPHSSLPWLVFDVVSVLVLFSLMLQCVADVGGSTSPKITVLIFTFEDVAFRIGETFHFVGVCFGIFFVPATENSLDVQSGTFFVHFKPNFSSRGGFLLCCQTPLNAVGFLLKATIQVVTQPNYTSLCMQK